MKKYDVRRDGDKYEVVLIAGFARFVKGEFNTKKQAENWIATLEKFDSARVKIEDTIRSLQEKLNVGETKFKHLVYEVLEES